MVWGIELATVIGANVYKMGHSTGTSGEFANGCLSKFL
jgi:hypothetical protein